MGLFIDNAVGLSGCEAQVRLRTIIGIGVLAGAAVRLLTDLDIFKYNNNSFMVSVLLNSLARSKEHHP